RAIVAGHAPASAGRAFAEAARRERPAVGEEQGVAIEVPAPTPTGRLIAWKPALLSVRVDSGSGSRFGSDSLQPLRGLARYTTRLGQDKPYFARFELEGGRFETQNQGLGSTGLDWTVRLLVGAATRITSGVILIASAGLLTRYEVGRSQGGAATIGIFRLDANIELEMRLFPSITLSG